MTKIFISYRRDDSADIVGRIRQNLTQPIGKLPAEDIFVDVGSIPLGSNVRKFIDERVRQCAVMLVVIGRDWVTIKDDNGDRRLDAPNDFVRIEIEAALKRDIPIIPILVRGARMPKESDLPESIRSLVDYNGMPVRNDPDFDGDITRLTNALESLMAELANRPSEPSPSTTQTIPVTPKKKASRPRSAGELATAQSIGNKSAIDVGLFQKLRVFEGHSAAVTTCTFTPDGQIIFSATNRSSYGSGYGEHTLWDVFLGKPIRKLGPEPRYSTNGCAFNLNGQQYATIRNGGSLRVWDIHSHTEQFLRGLSSGSWRCLFSPAGQHVIFSEDKTIKIWEFATNTLSASFSGHTDDVLCFDWSLDGSLIASGSKDNTVRLWDATAGTQLKLFINHIAPVTGCVFTPDATRLISTSEDTTIRYWDVASGKQVRAIATDNGQIQGCTLSPDGHTLATIHQGNETEFPIMIWDVKAAKMVNVLRGHKGKINQCVFSPDGKTLLSCSDDKTLILWGVPSSN